MSTAPKVYGWCPGALRPMMSGDGLVVRIRAPLGRLTSEQAKAVADLSTRYGNGVLDLSARANLQMRGVREDSHPALIAALQDLGLVEQDAHAEARRNILMTPFWADGDRSHHIALALTERLAQAEDLPLPGKFGFAVDAGQVPILQGAAADIRIEGAGDRLTLRADGAHVALEVCKDNAAAEALILARWFLDQGGASEGRGRMRALLARRAAPESHTANVARGASQPAPGQTRSGALVALEFGQITAETFAALADHGPLRLTPWRMLLIENAQDLAPLPGLIHSATDPRLRVSACTGAPGCLQALAETRALARDLAPHLPESTSLHVSGCAKGCAHPAPCATTLTATAEGRFDLIRDGRASDTPETRDLTLTELLTKDL